MGMVKCSRLSNGSAKCPCEKIERDVTQLCVTVAGTLLLVIMEATVASHNSMWSSILGSWNTWKSFGINGHCWQKRLKADPEDDMITALKFTANSNYIMWCLQDRHKRIHPVWSIHPILPRLGSNTWNGSQCLKHSLVTHRPPSAASHFICNLISICLAIASNAEDTWDNFFRRKREMLPETDSM